MPIVSFGGCSRPLSQQGIGATEYHDKFSHAITMLYVQSILTEGETIRARRRLIKRIESDNKQSGGDTND